LSYNKNKSLSIIAATEEELVGYAIVFVVDLGVDELVVD